MWPYTDLWDVKPPLLFALQAGFAALGGGSTLAPRLGSILCVALSGWGLHVFGLRHLRCRAAGLWAATLLPPYTVLMNGLGGRAELLLLPLVVAGCLQTLNGRAWAAGLLLGAACMIKQTALFETAFCGAAVMGVVPVLHHVRHRARHRVWHRARQGALFAAGCAVVPVGFAALFAWHGTLGAALAACAGAALLRTGGDGGTPGGVPLRFLAMLRPMLPLLVGALLLWAERARLNALPARRGLLFVLGWVGASSLGVLAVHANYAFYVLPLLPGLALGCGFLLAALPGWLRNAVPNAAARAALTGMLGAACLAYPAIFFAGTEDAVAARSHLLRDVAASLRARLRPGASLYVVDVSPLLHLLTGTRTVTPFVNPQQVVCPFPAAPLDPRAEVARIIARAPACIVVSATRRRMVCEQPAISNLAVSLAEARGYTLADRVGDEREDVDILCR